MLEHIVFVPYLGSLFQNIHELSRNQRLADVFVPYWGSLFQNESKHIQSHVKCVFVPCWGSLFQNMQIPMWIVSLAWFSSPAGVLYFKILTSLWLWFSAIGFRPLLGFFISKLYIDKCDNYCRNVFAPCWGSLFQNKEIRIKNVTMQNVFVPCWGSLFQNVRLNEVGDALNKVFVPYWGSLFQNVKNLWKERTGRGFSSPTGVLYFKIIHTRRTNKWASRFSSPTGVLYFKIETRDLLICFYAVFVPYWGSLFQNCGTRKSGAPNDSFSSPTGVLYFKIKWFVDDVKVVDRFRPLLGFFISK